MQDAIARGATNKNLRLMFRLIRKSLEFEISQDRTNYLLDIVASLSDDEIFILITHYNAKLNNQQEHQYIRSGKAWEELMPNTFSAEMHDAMLQRLMRTGFIIARSAYNGLIYHTTPLLDEVIELVELQAFNNINLSQ
jgi:hypothetical protein